MVDGQRYKLGIMQGRLLPRFRSRYQAHPVEYWQAEFHIARELGFDLLEFIVDANDLEQNPLMSQSGLDELQQIISESGVGVETICGDVFMERPFHKGNSEVSIQILSHLVESAERLGAKEIGIPLVDQSKLETKDDWERVRKSVLPVLEKATGKGIVISFETDLSPNDQNEFLSLFEGMVKATYDIGNSASLGFDPVEEFEAYGALISSVHIKDRVLGGGSVKLGTGDANIPLVLRLLKERNYRGRLIMQSARADSYIEDLALVREQKRDLEAWIKN